MAAAKNVSLGDSRELSIPPLASDEYDRMNADPRFARVGAARSDDLQVRLHEAALSEMWAAVDVTAPLQQAGVLLGDVRQVGESFAVVVAHAIAFPQSEPEALQIRASRRAWHEILRLRDQKYRGLRVVGWFHARSGGPTTCSESDRFIQRYYFPAEWQVLCQLDPQRKEVVLFQRKGKQMTACGGYYGPAPTASVADSSVDTADDGPAGRRLPPALGGSKSPFRPGSEPDRLPPRPVPAGNGSVERKKEPEDAAPRGDSYLRDRFIERSLEKVVRLLKEPPLQARDYALFALVVLVGALVVFFRPSASGVGAAQIQALTEQVEKMNGRLESMESRLAKAPRPSAPGPRPTPENPRPPRAGQPDQQYTLGEGETLWSVSEMFYQDGSLMHALMKYNRIAKAEDLHPGEVLQIPPRQVLQRIKASMRAAKKR